MKHRESIRHLKIWIMILIMAWLPIAASVENPYGVAKKQLMPWCSVNSSDKDDGLADWNRLPHPGIHIVRASKQAVAKKFLSRVTFVRIGEKEAYEYIRDGEKILHKSSLYLVRAAGINIDQSDLTDTINIYSPFDAMYSPSRDKLSIINSSLSHGDAIPMNLALVVESPRPIAKFSAECVTAE